MSRALAIKAKQYVSPLEKIPTNGKDFFQWTGGNGIVCKGCNSKIFYGYSNWKNHLKTKKHLKWAENFDKKEENKEMIKLREELKNQKALTVKYCNLYEQTKNKLTMIEKELKKLKKEIEKKFGIK